VTSGQDDVAAWVARAPDVPREWFRRDSRLHGVRHIQRVHIHAQRLCELLECDEADARPALRAALVHDIGRRHDGVDPWHGASSAVRAERLGLVADLAPDEAALVRFAVTYHSRSDARARAREDEVDGVEAGRALRILWLLKDADALDRVRLGSWESADPRMLRHPQTELLRPFADDLFAALGP
jgi:HD superfamily phosphodiesterase